MAYKGYLIKVGSYTIPLSLIKAESYKVTNYGQDLDSYQSIDGLLHRNALELQAPKVEFETKSMLTNTYMTALLNGIQANYTIPLEKKASVEVYVPELDKYIINDMYMADFSPTIYHADSEIIQYLSTRIAFISYGVKTT